MFWTLHSGETDQRTRYEDSACRGRENENEDEDENEDENENEDEDRIRGPPRPSAGS
jgi:hypothetical protein